MSFFNSFSIRISLAVIGGILYGLLTYGIVIVLGLSSGFPAFAGLFVFLVYFGSRLLILLSGIDSLYYSRARTVSEQIFEKNHFYQTVQWVGKFYHYHDIALLSILIALSTAFLITLLVDLWGGKSVGYTFQFVRSCLMTLL